ncbi:MAG: flagellar hook-associated protein 3 [Armatimonadetes bacterium]|nr:flagellar hook-associated protein 3 [Armatimonadota bacterium]MBS1726995.1 flagellar hook-associated protein FlgL [Armatimonadota bacterium]
MNRVSTFYQFSTLQSQVARAGEAYYDAQKKVSTGKRINVLGDDPTGFGSVVSMKGVKAGLTQYSANLDRANNWYSTTENTMSEVTTLMNRANALAVSGATATTGQTERQAMASEVTSIRDRLLQLANAKDGSGNYIFAGTATSTTPFSLNGNTIAYNGDTGKVKVEAAPGQTMDLSLPGTDTFFQSAYDHLTTMIDAMNNNDSSTLSNTSLTDVQADLQVVNMARGEIGNRVRTLDDYQSDHSRRIDELTKGVSDIEDVDLAQAITDYQSAQTAYQAALQMVSQGSKLSLMDYISG